jgi:hypothetical protein
MRGGKSSLARLFAQAGPLHQTLIGLGAARSRERGGSALV